METDLAVNADQAAITRVLKACTQGDAVNCPSEQVFELAKQVLVKEKITGISIHLLDESGYVVRQVTGKRRDELDTTDFSDRQLAVIKALEKVLRHCKKEGIRLVGYSDELVAYPACCKDLTQASVFALDIDTSGSYAGAESIAPLVE